VLHGRAVADGAIDEPGVGADLAAVAHHGVALQDGSRVEGDVASELHRDVHERLARVEHRHAVEQPVAVRARAQLALGHRELPTVVHAFGLRFADLHAADAVAHCGQRGDDVGEVVLALCVVGAEVA